ncbi:ubiquinol-cytochrome c chaperone [Thalassobaculum fulvum]|uniref:Ubiquinol-cytochrome c chaperone n=1 Tax=Thalassobaculum fulvum TaxID=1633335 RepID=A0A919CNZ3_9PROT|nr:ubiquinol-cytochrome C chaperone family protein [Thalassobaculum fulvum]GHD47602.1 ubiquinol-cytochrome c chaperone [Thalassobaculum fulvum]
MVFERLFKGRRQQRPAEAVYEAVVRQARHPVFYTEYGVVDGFEERFDMLVLHVHLVVRRLAEGGAADRAQEVFDALFFDMDRTLRAIGVGDMSVGKRVKDMIRAYYGRTASYEAALTGPAESALAAALARNVFGSHEAGAGAERLARHVRVTVAALAAQPTAEIANGSIGFPDPGSTA